MQARDAWDAAGAPEPSVALQIASIWADEKGFKVAPMRRREATSYRVHTCRPTVPEPEGEGTVGRACSSSQFDEPPPKVPHLRLVHPLSETSEGSKSENLARDRDLSSSTLSVT